MASVASDTLPGFARRIALPTALKLDGGAHPESPDLAAASVAVPLRLRDGDGGELSFISTVTTFGTAVDITVSELSIEAFFSADAATAGRLRELAGG